MVCNNIFRCFFLFFVCFHFSIAPSIGQENQKAQLGGQLFKSFLLDQFVEEQLSVLSPKLSSGLHEHFIQPIKKLKSKAFKEVFIGYVFDKFSFDEIQTLNLFYLERRESYQKRLSPEMQKKFSELITDVPFLLANTPNHEKTGLNDLSLKNENPEMSVPHETPPKGFHLGEFVATSLAEELHYIKMEVELKYEGQGGKIFEENKPKLRDIITTLLMRLPLQKAKEDYMDHFLHKDFERAVQEFLEKLAPGQIKIKQVHIPTFIVNW
jgi:hypothetical protein